jgi:hypothetical protein
VTNLNSENYKGDVAAGIDWGHLPECPELYNWRKFELLMVKIPEACIDGFTKLRKRMRKNDRAGSRALMNKKTYLFGERKILLAALLLLAALSGMSCKKFLDKELLGQYPETQFYQTQSQAVLAINAAYRPLAFYTAQNRLWVFGDVASDDAEQGGNPGDQADIGLINDFNINPINGNLGDEWSLLYEGITRCNIVLDNIPAIDMDESLKTRILGEAKFLRAWYYFNLVTIFGDVPSSAGTVKRRPAADRAISRKHDLRNSY